MNPHSVKFDPLDITTFTALLLGTKHMPLHDQSKEKSPWTAFPLHLSTNSVHMVHCDRHFSLLWHVCFWSTEHSSGYIIIFGGGGGGYGFHT